MSTKLGRQQGSSNKLAFPPARATKASLSRAAFIAADSKDKAPAILELPEEVLCRILAHLPSVHDVLACGQVCREWFKALRSDVLWQGQYSRTWGHEQATKAADSIFLDAETQRSIGKLPQNVEKSRSLEKLPLNTGGKPLGATESPQTVKGAGTSVQSNPLSQTGIPDPVSKLVRGVGRLALSPGSKRGGPRTKQNGQGETALSAWRDAFAARFKMEKRKFLTSEISLATSLGLLTRRRGSGSQESRAIDPLSGMLRLVERLQLRFEMRINNGRAISLGGRNACQLFTTSLSLKCPPFALGQGLTVQKLLKVEVTGVSDRLYSVTRLLQIDSASIRNSRLVTESPPLSLYESSLYPDSTAEGGSLIIGTFASEDPSTVAPQKASPSDGVSNRSSGQLRESIAGSTSKEGAPGKDEEVVLLVLNVPFVDLLWRVMALGPGNGPREMHRPLAHDTDLQYGLHDFHASAQIRSFGKLLWCQDFHRCFSSKRESVPGEKAVFVFLPTEGGMPALFQGTPKLAWRTEAFSGELPGALVLDFVLWDQNSEATWHCSKVVGTRPASAPASPEFGLPYLDGECLHATVEDASRGFSLSLDLRVPSKDPDKRAGQDILPQSAVTGLRLSLTSRFLTNWFGTSRI